MDEIRLEENRSKFRDLIETSEKLGYF